MAPHERFSVRVYGILERNGEILVSHEHIMGSVHAKFPGGGLEFGEGPKDALVREYMEELGIAVTVTSHLYTTDFYLPSAFDPKVQVISIYYRVAASGGPQLPFDLPTPSDSEVMNQGQIFRWYPVMLLTDELLTLPADRVVARILRGDAA